MLVSGRGNDILFLLLWTHIESNNPPEIHRMFHPTENVSERPSTKMLPMAPWSSHWWLSLRSGSLGPFGGIRWICVLSGRIDVM